MYYHTIFFNFSSKLSSSEANSILLELGGLQKQIPQIVSYQFGENDIANINNKIYGHCFIMTFANKEDRYIYQEHPLHQAFIKTRLMPIVEEAVVLDFENLAQSYTRYT